MDQEIQSRIRKEVLFFIGALATCTGFFFFLSYLMNQEFILARYVESMIVIMLVCYLIRFVFIVMNKLK